MELRFAGNIRILEFYDYRAPIQPRTMVNVLNLAMSAAQTHEADTLIALRTMTLGSDEVRLILYPESQMTWDMWMTALMGMRSFVLNIGMHFGWSFIVMEAGMYALLLL